MPKFASYGFFPSRASTSCQCDDDEAPTLDLPITIHFQPPASIIHVRADASPIDADGTDAAPYNTIEMAIFHAFQTPDHPAEIRIGDGLYIESPNLPTLEATLTGTGGAVIRLTDRRLPVTCSGGRWRIQGLTLEGADEGGPLLQVGGDAWVSVGPGVRFGAAGVGLEAYGRAFVLVEDGVVLDALPEKALAVVELRGNSPPTSPPA